MLIYIKFDLFYMLSQIYNKNRKRNESRLMYIKVSSSHTLFLLSYWHQFKPEIALNSSLHTYVLKNRQLQFYTCKFIVYLIVSGNDNYNIGLI
jgi:hypothetical protein